MDRWQGKVAVVTGASSGIGAAISEALVKNGLKVVGLARREDKLKELENALRGPKGKQFYSVKTDLRKEEEIVSAFQWVEKNLGGVHVLVNNAGMNKMQVLQAQDVEDWREVYDVNLLALQICTKEALKSMKTHNINDGQIINISSMAAHVSSPIPGLGTYFASKKAVNAISEAFRVELQAQNSDIRVTTISPGLVNTEILGAAGLNFPPEVLAIALKVSDVADTVIYALQLAPHILLSELVIQTVKYIGDAVVKANSVRQQ